MPNFHRRALLQIIAASSAWLSLPKFARSDDAPAALPTQGESLANATRVSWSDTHDRVFLSGDCWANPMEDWRVVDGAAECQKAANNRNIHLVTHQLTKPGGNFSMTVELSQVEMAGTDGGAGFQVGIRSDINEYRSNCFSRGGVTAGVKGGKLMIGKSSKAVAGLDPVQGLTLTLTGTDGELTLVAMDTAGVELGRISQTVNPDLLLGNVALVNNFGHEKRKNEKANGSRYRFNNWSVSGEAFTVTPSHRFGPLLWTMYSLSDSRSDEGFVLKMSALTGPLGVDDNQQVELMIQRDGQWLSQAMATLDTDAWTATFRIANWDQTRSTPYKVVYRETHPSGQTTDHQWTGTIKPNPEGRPLRMAGLTCQKDYGFPYEPVAENLIRLDADLLFFSGDQLYENHGGFGFIRDPADRAILNYLRKYYMHGWAFRDAMKDSPTICLPDDHDVFQGNIWGESGAPMKIRDSGASEYGGYREPAAMVNAVHKTTVGHHPDYFDATPVQQGISVYYGDMVYGNVSFAIIADRQFKSGPETVDTGEGRADHVPDPDFDTASLDKPGLVLLGQRQEDFLRQWVNDWRGHMMKVLMSQTVFSGVATHHGDYDGYLKGDLDSSGWPQTPRDNAIRILKPGMPLHVNGDQHLASLSQYGVDQQRDGCWAFCTPAIAAGYPRWWRPDDVGMPHENRPAHGLPNTGEYLDGFGNKVFMYAVGNPEPGTEKNRYKLAHQKGSGFGMITIDTDAKTYFLEAFRFSVDATDGKASNQFEGWPVTIHQEENAGKNRL